MGDGLVAHGFIRELADRGHELHIAARAVDLQSPITGNVILHMIPQRVSKRPFDRLEYMFRVRTLFNELHPRIRFDLAHQMNPVFTGLSLCMLGSGVPIVLGTYVPIWPDDPDAISSSNHYATALLHGAKRVVSLMQQSNADALLLTSPAALNRIPRHRRIETRIHALQHGIDTSLFSPFQERTEGKVPSILYLSNVHPKKGVFVLLDAFAMVYRRSPNVRLSVVGKADSIEEFDRLRTQVEKEPWGKNVKFYGKVPRSQAVELYTSHSVYCLPSFGEPYATSVIEAMSCGRPIVTTNAGGMPYLVPEGGGILVPPGDSSKLAAALIYVLENPSVAESMGRCNRDWVIGRHTWGSVIDQLESVYAQVIDNRSTGIEAGSRKDEVPLQGMFEKTQDSRIHRL